MSKTITIHETLNKLPTIKWDKLKTFTPNNLKKKENRDTSDLKRSILEVGFAFPLFIWQDGEYITDGAGRFLVLEQLEYEGFEIPDIPFIPVKAKNIQEAKRLTLLISSQYGLTTPDSIGEFVFDLKEIDLSFVNIEGYNLEEISWTPPKTKEIDIDNIKGETKMQHTCPRCGLQFNVK